MDIRTTCGEYGTSMSDEIDQKMKVGQNKMELLQSQAPVEGELSGNSAVRKLDIGV